MHNDNETPWELVGTENEENAHIPADSAMAFTAIATAIIIVVGLAVWLVS